MLACPADWSAVSFAAVEQALTQQPDYCDVCNCPLELDGVQLANMQYRPSLAGNVILAALFALFLVAQVGLSIRYKTRGFGIAMACGLVLEIVGYIGRILLREHIFDFSYFVIYLVCLTIGPAFFAAAIYLTLSRIIVIYVPERARFRPQLYTFVFIAFDVIALILQATGGGIAASATPYTSAQKSGINIMVAGVAWQVAALGIFAALAADYWLRVARRDRRAYHLNPAFETLRSRRAFQPLFLIALCLAGVFIFVRSVFRCAELSDGFNGALANNEVTFMVLEGAMIILASGLLTVFHPGFVYGGRGMVQFQLEASQIVAPLRLQDAPNRFKFH